MEHDGLGAGATGLLGMLATLAEGAARDLVIHWPRVEPTLAVPPCEFGIVAGGRGDSSFIDRMPTNAPASVGPASTSTSLAITSSFFCASPLPGNVVVPEMPAKSFMPSSPSLMASSSVVR